MAQMNPKFTIRPVYFGMLLLVAAVMILEVRLTIASEWVDLLKAAAEQGDVDAQLFLGYTYDGGVGAPQSDTEAVRWYRMAAEQGSAEAQSSLGSMYFSGRGVSQNHTEAVRWFRTGAEQGSADAQASLGYMYSEGLGVPQDRICRGAVLSRSHVRVRQRRPQGCS